VGWGLDVHRLGGDPPILLAGVEVDQERGVIATSDGDVVAHAVADALLGAAALFVGAAAWAVGSAIAMVTLGDGAWLAESADWIEVVKWCGKAVFGLLPYIVLAAFVAVLTSSSGAAIGIGLGYYMVESILVGVLFNFDWFERVAEFLIGPAGYGWMGLPGGMTFSYPAELPDAAQSFVVLLGYVLVLGGAAIWLFQRRDIAGAKGE